MFKSRDKINYHAKPLKITYTKYEALWFQVIHSEYSFAWEIYTATTQLQNHDFLLRDEF